VFNSTRALKVETVIHEIAHALDHQVIGEARVFASLASDLLGSTEALEVMSEIRASQTFKTVSAYSAGQIVLGRVLQPAAINYHQDPREWFARAYTQYIGLRSGDPELLAFIGRSRPSSGRPLVYPEAWPDQEFKPILSAMERLLVRKNWIR
jgi:hypothetical protein